MSESISHEQALGNALDAHRSHIQALPGVRGMGLGKDASDQYYIAVDIDNITHFERTQLQGCLPQELLLELSGGVQCTLPVRLEEQGEIHLDI